MDLLAQKRMLFVLIYMLGIFSKNASADLFNFKKLEYFPLKTMAAHKPKEEINFSLDELWNSKDIVQMFLTNPNEETAKKYLMWQEERIKHLKNAMFVLDRLSLDQR